MGSMGGSAVSSTRHLKSNSSEMGNSSLMNFSKKYVGDVLDKAVERGSGSIQR